MGITGFWEYGFGIFWLDIWPPSWRNGSIIFWGKVSANLVGDKGIESLYKYYISYPSKCTPLSGLSELRDVRNLKTVGWLQKGPIR